MTNQIETIKINVGTKQAWAERAIVALFNKQTASEQYTQSTNENNGIGFNGVDAEILSSFAMQIIQYKRSLSPKQLAIAFKKLPKYAKQLATIAEEKALS